MCVSAILRSVARDAASPGPVVTPAPATLVSGSARRARTASVSLPKGMDGGAAGDSAGLPPDQPPPCLQMWTNVAACPLLVLPGAAKTRQAASTACAALVSELARGLQSAWVRNPCSPIQLQAPPSLFSLQTSSPPPRFPTPLQPKYCAGLAAGQAPRSDQLPLSLRPHHCLFLAQPTRPIGVVTAVLLACPLPRPDPGTIPPLTPPPPQSRPAPPFPGPRLLQPI